MDKLRLPYGISNFKTLVNENYFFVDKTNFIEQLEELNERYIVFLRPRRFGKSLFVSMLYYYYGLEHKDKFDNLFAKYYIGKNKTNLANKYYILNLNFSGINTTSKDNLLYGFRLKILSEIKDFEKRYNSLNNYNSNEMPSEIIETFFKNHKDKKIYIIVDEYDHFTNK